MRAVMAVMIGIVLFSAATAPDRPNAPTVSAEAVTLAEVRRASEIDVPEFGGSPDTLLVERPFNARQGAQSGVFVLDADGVGLRRVPVFYGRATTALIQIVNGVSAGDRIVVSDMQAWDQFDRLRLKLR